MVFYENQIIFLHVFTLFIFTLPSFQASSNTAEVDLHDSLLTKYKKWIRPVTDLNSTIILKYGAAIYQLVGFDTKAETIKVLLWQRLCWHDQLLTWKPEEHFGVSVLRISQEEIWVPDLLPYNDIGVFDATKYRKVVPLSVSSDGKVCWTTPIDMETTCTMNVRKFPFDRQVCTITIGSWQYKADEVDIFCLEHELDATSYSSHTQWTLEGTKCTRTEDIYPSGRFSAIHFTLEFKRLPGFYVRNLILPNAVLLALTSLIFFLPCEGGERIGFGITVTLALCVNLVIVIEFIPETSKTIPDVCDYFLVSISLSGFALLLATLILNLYTYSWEMDSGKHGKESCAPFWTKICFVKRFLKVSSAKILHVESCENNKSGGVKEQVQREESVIERKKDVNECVKRVDKTIGVVYFIATSLYTIIFITGMAKD